MITVKELSQSVEDSDLDETLFEELVDEHLALHKAFHRRDYEKALLKAGKFVETLFQNLEFLLDEEYSANPSINGVSERLKQTDKGTYPKSVRLMIPRRGKVMYGLRSKRGGAHKTEVDPRFMDAKCAASDSNWILSELIRLYSDREPDAVKAIIEHVVTDSLPFVEEFEDGDVMLLLEPDSCKEEELLILYHFYPNRVSNEEMKTYLDHQTSRNVTSSLGNAEDERLVHRNDDGSELTEKGKKYVENKFGRELEVAQSA